MQSSQCLSHLLGAISANSQRASTVCGHDPDSAARTAAHSPRPLRKQHCSITFPESNSRCLCSCDVYSSEQRQLVLDRSDQRSNLGVPRMVYGCARRHSQTRTGPHNTANRESSLCPPSKAPSCRSDTDSRQRKTPEMTHAITICSSGAGVSSSFFLASCSGSH